MGGRRFEASSARLGRSGTPARRPVSRGGAYVSGPTALQLECTVEDRSILPLLTGAMLGPSQDAEAISAESDGGRRLTASLASYVESGGPVRLRLVVDAPPGSD